MLLRDAGWEMDDILTVFADRLNGIPNASTGADSTPEGVPEYLEFQQVAEAIDEFEDKNLLIFAAGERENTDEIIILVDASARGTKEFADFTRLLRLNPNALVFRMSVGLIQQSDDEILIKTRPIMSVLYFLGQSVEVPTACRNAGRANSAVDELGDPFDWSLVHGDLITIAASTTEPADRDVYVKVKYSNSWFYVGINDIDSKETLTMISVVLTLKAGGIPTERPLLTLPVTGS